MFCVLPRPYKRISQNIWNYFFIFSGIGILTETTQLWTGRTCCGFNWVKKKTNLWGENFTLRFCSRPMNGLTKTERNEKMTFLIEWLTTVALVIEKVVLTVTVTHDTHPIQVITLKVISTRLSPNNSRSSKPHWNVKYRSHFMTVYFL